MKYIWQIITGRRCDAYVHGTFIAESLNDIFKYIIQNIDNYLELFNECCYNDWGLISRALNDAGYTKSINLNNNAKKEIFKSKLIKILSSLDFKYEGRFLEGYEDGGYVYITREKYDDIVQL